MTTLTAQTPEDLLAAVSVVLGFEPRDSVVMLTFGGTHTFHARTDLPVLGDVDQAVGSLLGPALRHRVRRVVFVIYSDDGPHQRTVVRRLRRAFTRGGIEVADVLRAHRGRWFVHGRSGVPSHGVPYDVSDHPFLVRAVFEGIVVQRSRDEVAELLRPLAWAVAGTEAALAHAAPSPPEEIADLVAARLDTGRFTDAELARVLLGLEGVGGRDAAAAAISRESARAYTRLWTDAVQRTPERLVAASAGVLAVAAWLAGHGALAWCAVDRCRAADPGDRLAGLVADVLERAVPPSAWAGVAG